MPASPKPQTVREHLERIRAAYAELTPEERTPEIAELMLGVEEIARLREELARREAERPLWRGN